MSFTIHSAQIRRDICKDCRQGCDQHRAGLIDHADPSAACPRRIWHAAPGFIELSRPAPLTDAQIAAGIRMPVGLGDLVEAVAAPVARWIDARTASLGVRWRTRLAGCQACGRRRHRLNRWVTDIRSIRSWLGAVKKLLSRCERSAQGSR